MVNCQKFSQDPPRFKISGCAPDPSVAVIVLSLKGLRHKGSRLYIGLGPTSLKEEVSKVHSLHVLQKRAKTIFARPQLMMNCATNVGFSETIMWIFN